jgi:hypothetical protein
MTTTMKAMIDPSDIDPSLEPCERVRAVFHTPAVPQMPPAPPPERNFQLAERARRRLLRRGEPRPTRLNVELKGIVRTPLAERLTQVAAVAQGKSPLA